MSRASFPSTSRRRRARGFSLVEMAISVMIVGLLAAGVIGSLSRQGEQRRFAETRLQLDRAREALLAFVTTNGRLPCPALPASAGHEAVTSAPGVSPVTCSRDWGLLPAVTLGLADVSAGGWLMNGWGDANAIVGGTPARALRYAVPTLSGAEANALTSPRLGATDATATTRRAAVQARFAANDGWFVCASAAGAAAAGNRCGITANTLGQSVAAVVWSNGPNGANGAGSWSADEVQNEAVVPLRITVSRTQAPQGAAGGGGFDDQVTWIPFTLVAERLVTAGLLP